MVIQGEKGQGVNLQGQDSSERKQGLRQRFQIVRKLGQGTYGKVQLAINKVTKQEVAIKTIKKAKIENEQDLLRIRREIQIMSSVQHPHIIHIYEVFENKEKIVLIMQYASGGELYDYLGCNRRLPEKEARRIFRQVASAIYYCHKNKICHRDLKLENILLDDKGNAKIADFGLSNVFDEKKKLHTFCGSPLYASPEIVKGIPYCGPEVDCWSLGVLLYTLIYGAMPFDGSNFRRLVKQITEGTYYEPSIKSRASGIIRRLLTVDVTARATIKDICLDSWVNEGYDHSLLTAANDMANLTPVRKDSLLALSSTSFLSTTANVAHLGTFHKNSQKLNIFTNEKSIISPTSAFQQRLLDLVPRKEQPVTKVDFTNKLVAKEGDKEAHLPERSTKIHERSFAHDVTTDTYNDVRFIVSKLVSSVESLVKDSDIIKAIESLKNGKCINAPKKLACSNFLNSANITDILAASQKEVLTPIAETNSKSNLKENFEKKEDLTTKTLSDNKNYFNSETRCQDESKNPCVPKTSTKISELPLYKKDSFNLEPNIEIPTSKNNIPLEQAFNQQSMKEKNTQLQNHANQLVQNSCNQKSKFKLIESENFLPIFNVSSIIPKRRQSEPTETNVKNYIPIDTAKDESRRETVQLKCSSSTENSKLQTEVIPPNNIKKHMNTLSTTALERQINGDTHNSATMHSTSRDTKVQEKLQETHVNESETNINTTYVPCETRNESELNSIEKFKKMCNDISTATTDKIHETILDTDNKNKSKNECSQRHAILSEKCEKEIIDMDNATFTSKYSTSVDSLLQNTDLKKSETEIKILNTSKNSDTEQHIDVNQENNIQVPEISNDSTVTPIKNTEELMKSGKVECDTNIQIKEIKDFPSTDNYYKICQKFWQKPRRLCFNRIRAASLQFERLPELSKKQTRSVRRLPGKITIPKYFDAEAARRKSLERKQLFLIPTVSVAENKEKLEKKIEMVKKSALSLTLRRKSEVIGKPKLKKYRRSYTDILQRLEDKATEDEYCSQLNSNSIESEFYQEHQNTPSEEMDYNNFQYIDQYVLSHLEQGCNEAENSESYEKMYSDEEFYQKRTEKQYVLSDTESSCKNSPDINLGEHSFQETDSVLTSVSELTDASTSNNVSRSFTPSMLQAQVSGNQSISSSIESVLLKWEEDYATSNEGTFPETLRDEFILKENTSDTNQSGYTPIRRCYKKINFPSEQIYCMMYENDINNTINDNSLCPSVKTNTPNGTEETHDFIKKSKLDALKVKDNQDVEKLALNSYEKNFEETDKNEHKIWKRSSDWSLSYSNDKDSSDNDDDLDMSIFDTKLESYESEDLWKFLKALNKDLDNQIKAIKHAPKISAHGRSKSQESRVLDDPSHIRSLTTRSLSREERKTNPVMKIRHNTENKHAHSSETVNCNDILCKVCAPVLNSTTLRLSNYKSLESMEKVQYNDNYKSNLLTENTPLKRHSLTCLETPTFQETRNIDKGMEYGYWASNRNYDPCAERLLGQMTPDAIRNLRYCPATLPRRLSTDKRSKSHIYLNGDTDYFLSYSDKMKTCNESKLQSNDVTQASKLKVKALSDLDIRNKDPLLKNKFEPHTIGYKETAFKTPSRFSTSPKLTLNETLSANFGERHLDTRTNKRSNYKTPGRKVSFSLDADTPHKHKNSFLKSHTVDVSDVLKSENFNPVINSVSENNEDSGSLLEALKTYGYKSIMSQRLKENDENFNETSRITFPSVAGWNSTDFISGTVPTGKQANISKHIDSILKANRLILNKKFPCNPTNADNILIERPISDFLPDTVDSMAHGNFKPSFEEWHDLYENEESHIRNLDKQIMRLKMKDTKNDYQTNFIDLPFVSRNYGTEINVNSSLPEQSENFGDKYSKNSLEELSMKIQALKTRCRPKCFEEADINKEITRKNFLNEGTNSEQFKSTTDNNDISRTNFETLTSDTKEEESVSDRIWRKSFYSRFNDLPTLRRRRSLFLETDFLSDTNTLKPTKFCFSPDSLKQHKKSVFNNETICATDSIQRRLPLKKNQKQEQEMLLKQDVPEIKHCLQNGLPTLECNTEENIPETINESVSSNQSEP